MCLEVDSWSILSCWRAYRSMLVIRMLRVILAVDLTYLQLTFHREVWCHDSQFFIMENSIIDVLNTLIYTSLVYVVFVLMQHSIRMMLLVTNTNMRQASAGIFCDCLLQTPKSHTDCSLLEEAVSVVEEVIAEVDTKTGLSKCQFAISCLDYVDDRQVFTC